ncbi:MAG: S8 family serine peptidase [Sphingobacteriales bacterium]|nr:S8 family serine peptidase [Sphingobacteriales bacterium]
MLPYVAGVLGAEGNYFQRYSIAPRSNLFYWDVANDIVKEVADGKSTYAVDISNHSYNFAPTNCYESGLYIPEASDLDKAANQHPTLLPIVAVGNTAVGCVVTDTFSSVDIGFQGCKNSITVGWLFPNERIIENSGRGPTADGRLKPELVAKGFQVGTVGPNNAIPAIAYGSSFAAPQVAGLAALIHQKYRQQFGAFPNASLVKALLCNTARDLGNPGPDYIFGFGIPNILKAIVSLDNNQFFEDNVSQGVFKTHDIVVPSGMLNLNVTADWTDKEGSPIASKALVNDLDLKLVTPAGDTVLPWLLNPMQYKNTATRGVDNLNNIEQVTVSFPQAGTYQIVVKGSNVPFGPQDYSVTYAFQKREIEITHPNGGEFLDAGSSSVIKWIRNGIDSLCKIQFSSDSGDMAECCKQLSIFQSNL